MKRAGLIAAFLIGLTNLACGVSQPQREFPGNFNLPPSSALTQCTDAGLLLGVDVSKYDETVDWTAAHDAGVVFAFARVSDGLTHPDPYFASNWSQMRSVGVIRGAYQYFRASEDPHQQAALVLAAIPDFGPGDLPPVIDVETLDGLDAGPAAAAITAWVADIHQALGRTPLIYTSARVWTEFDNPPLDADLWTVNWDVSCPAIPTTWSAQGWIFWQYSASGAVPGLTAEAADLDRFNGSLSQLETYAYTLEDAGADAGSNDGGSMDAGLNDAGSNDAGSNDAGVRDAGSIDAGSIDAGVCDGGPSCAPKLVSEAGGCSNTGAGSLAALGAMGILWLRRKRTLRTPRNAC